MTPDFKAIASRIGGLAFFDDPEFKPSVSDAMVTTYWDDFMRVLERELRKEFGAKAGMK